MTVVFATSMFGMALGAFAVMVRFFELRLRLENEVACKSAIHMGASQHALIKANNTKTDVFANGVQARARVCVRAGKQPDVRSSSSP